MEQDVERTVQIGILLFLSGDCDHVPFFDCHLQQGDTVRRYTEEVTN
jgi:hypothetical protein